MRPSISTLTTSKGGCARQARLQASRIRWPSLRGWSKPRGRRPPGASAAPPVVAAAPVAPPPPVVTPPPLEAGALRPAFDDLADPEAEAEAEAPETEGFAEADESALDPYPAKVCRSAGAAPVEPLALDGVCARHRRRRDDRRGVRLERRPARLPEVARRSSPRPKGRPRCSRRATPPSRPRTTPAPICSRTTRRPTRSRSSTTRSSRSISTPRPRRRRQPDADPAVRWCAARSTPRWWSRRRSRRRPLPRSPSRSRCARFPCAPTERRSRPRSRTPRRARRRRPSLSRSLRRRRRRGPAAKPPADAASAQASTPKIDLPTKLSPPKSSARVVVAKTDTTAPGGAAEAVGEPVQPGAAAKPEKPAKVKPQEAAATPAAPAAEAGNEPATASGGWAVQLAAPRSEAEAKGVVVEAQREIRLRPRRIGARRPQGDRQRRHGLPRSRDRSVEGRRRIALRPDQGRRRTVLRREVTRMLIGGAASRRPRAAGTVFRQGMGERDAHPPTAHR